MIRLITIQFLAALVVTAACSAPAAEAADRIRIVASTNDLASIATAVGGDRVEATAICRPNADPHRVEVLPSYMVRVSRARLYLKVGLGLDTWADQIVDGSHNSRITVIDCSKGVTVLERPPGRVDASMGDVHPDGNPHYWLDPRNGAVVARLLATELSKIDPENAAAYSDRAGRLATEAESFLEKARKDVAALPGRGIITYHRSWTYLADALGLEILSTIEPMPGIPPTGKHLDQLVTLIRTEKPVLVLQEPYFSRDAGRFLNRETGVRLVTLPPSAPDAAAGSYLAHFETLLAQIRGTAGGAGGMDDGGAHR